MLDTKYREAFDQPLLGRCQQVFCSHFTGTGEAVLRIHDILVWIRIRGSMPLTDGPDPDPAIFVIDLQDASKKLIF